jgi:hypothetical protein
MRESHCPVCATELVVRDVAPCFECGGDPHELEELAAGEHTYAELRALGELVVLCDFCQADFTSYDPAYFNRPRGTKLGLGEFEFIRELQDPRPGKDKFCGSCNHRLAFLRFLVRVRANAQAV